MHTNDFFSFTFVESNNKSSNKRSKSVVALKVGDLCCAAEDVTASTIEFSHIGEVVALHVDRTSNSSGKYMVDFYEGMYKKKEGMDIKQYQPLPYLRQHVRHLTLEEQQVERSRKENANGMATKKRKKKQKQQQLQQRSTHSVQTSFHQAQEGDKCAMHAVNNCLLREHVTVEELQKLSGRDGGWSASHITVLFNGQIEDANRGIIERDADPTYQATTVNVKNPELKSWLDNDAVVGWITKPKKHASIIKIKDKADELVWHWIAVRRKVSGQNRFVRVDSKPTVDDKSYTGYNSCISDMKRHHHDNLIVIYRRNHSAFKSLKVKAANARTETRKRKQEDETLASSRKKSRSISIEAGGGGDLSGFY